MIHMLSKGRQCHQQPVVLHYSLAMQIARGLHWPCDGTFAAHLPGLAVRKQAPPGPSLGPRTVVIAHVRTIVSPLACAFIIVVIAHAWTLTRVYAATTTMIHDCIMFTLQTDAVIITCACMNIVHRYMYHDHSIYISYDQRTRIYPDHNTCMHNSHCTRMDYNHSTCLYFEHAEHANATYTFVFLLPRKNILRVVFCTES